MNRSLRVLTQNMKLFSSAGKLGARVAGETVWSNAYDEKRTARLIDAILSAKPQYDIVCLQEVFNESRRWQLKKTLKKNHYWVTPKFGDSLREDSGLFIACRHPMGSHTGRIFDDHAGSDALAAKGVIAYRLTLEASAYGVASLWLANTHLQANDNPGARQARKQQFKDVRAVLNDPIGRGMPALLLGDLNVDEESAEHPVMLKALGRPSDLLRVVHEDFIEYPAYTFNPAKNALADPGPPERLDYILGYGRGDHRMLVLSAKVQTFKTSKKDRLSDHFGIEARLRFELQDES
jgi:endonuclease/exonuclease/phosphatase family metal-dependent hydrolase